MRFEFDEQQEAKVREFFANHVCTIPDHPRIKGMKMTGAIGGARTYTFTPTSIGTVVKAKCACGAEIDLSDYENW